MYSAVAMKRCREKNRKRTRASSQADNQAGAKSNQDDRFIHDTELEPMLPRFSAQAQPSLVYGNLPLVLWALPPASSVAGEDQTLLVGQNYQSNAPTQYLFCYPNTGC
jgi:hypothetical protein